ncbi:MAG: homocysteine S-methyltransferase family protein [Phascolarctobacterium sp.]|nr:homocysteine S-methyltransferase family protein [Phascolarctobacterium sp.]
MDLSKLSGKKIIFFDGAMGTVLQSRGLSAGELPETWNITHPDIIEGVHLAYLEAGADIIKTNTFGANRLKFTEHESDTIIKRGVEIAKKACAKYKNAVVALDLGPTGKLLAPYGDLPFEEAVDVYAGMIKSGKSADVILIETMSDIYEAKAAILAAKENCDLPIMVTFTFDESGRLLTGGSVAAAAAMAEGLGADAIGFNCGVGPAQLEKLLPDMLYYSNLPVILNPNAGMPEERNGMAHFELSPKEFANLMYGLVKQGVSIAGGCCGTTPDHIAALVKKCKGVPAGGCRNNGLTIVSSYGKAIVIGKDPLIIGERINPTGKPRLKEALKNGDMDYVCRLGLEQIAGGAHILDVNVGMPGINEASAAAKAVVALQAVTDTPLQIDTSDYAAMECALRLYNGRPILNSVNGKKESLEKVLPIAKKYGAVLVALSLDDNGIPKTAAERIAIAERIMETAAEYGIKNDDILVDPLVLTISTGSENAKTTLEVIRELRNRGIRTIMGVSNISFGLPVRDAINSTFFTLALKAGLSCGIINPQSRAMVDVYCAYRALNGIDENCGDYIEHFAGTKEPEVSGTGNIRLYDAIVKGLTGAAKSAVDAALKKEDPLDIINNHLIPALDYVGKGFEEKKLYLPQLLMSADAARAAFDILRDTLGGKGRDNGEAVVIATVHGDIHDIGKNIVKVLLQNYGYKVIDLGKDVPADDVVKAAKEHGARVVGLSALMTTTVPAMAETISALRRETDCRIVVGGAVLTAEWANAIGADSYAASAVNAVQYANSILGK